MKIGDPLDRSTDHGPQNHKAHLDKLVEYCERGVKEGATLVCGGKQVSRPGKEGVSLSVHVYVNTFAAFWLVMYLVRPWDDLASFLVLRAGKVEVQILSKLSSSFQCFSRTKGLLSYAVYTITKPNFGLNTVAYTHRMCPYNVFL